VTPEEYEVCEAAMTLDDRNVGSRMREAMHALRAARKPKPLCSVKQVKSSNGMYNEWIIEDKYGQIWARCGLPSYAETIANYLNNGKLA
jgi:hypothetical protein